jgi:hypothetical protein
VGLSPLGKEKSCAALSFNNLPSTFLILNDLDSSESLTTAYNTKDPTRDVQCFFDMKRYKDFSCSKCEMGAGGAALLCKALVQLTGLRSLDVRCVGKGVLSSMI